MMIERSTRGKKLGLGRGRRGWLFTIIVVVGPVWLLFHPPFATRVVLSFVQDMNSMVFQSEVR